MKMPGFTADATLYTTRRHYATLAALYEGSGSPSSADGLLRFQALGHPPGSCATRCAAMCRRCASEPENCDYGYCFEECIDLNCCEEGCGPCKLVGGQCQKLCVDDDCDLGMQPCDCPPGQTCTFDGCCPISQGCGHGSGLHSAYCCRGEEVCTGDPALMKCCIPCGTDCCERGMICKDGACCTPYNQGCCPRGQYCGKDVCCPPGYRCAKNPRGQPICI